MTALRSIAAISGAPINPARFPQEEFLLYSIPAHACGKPVAESGAKIKSLKTLVDEGDVLISKLNPRIPRVWLVEGVAGRRRICSTEFIPFRVTDSARVDPEYLSFMMLAPQFIGELAGVVRSSTKSHQRVRREDIEQRVVPVPSLPEQRRIVARIKNCLERVEEIKVLRDALTDAREALRFSSASIVFGELQSSCESLTIGELVAGERTAMRSGPFGSAMKHDEFVASGKLVIGIANVQRNEFDPIRKWMITDAKFQEMERYAVEPGDLLITIMGTIGRACVVPEGIGSAITSKHVYRIRLPRQVNAKYVSFFLNFSDSARRQLYGSAAGGVMPGLNATKLRELRIPVPDRLVQDETVERLERLHETLSELDELKKNDGVEFLRDAVLRKAFAGEL